VDTAGRVGGNEEGSDGNACAEDKQHSCEKRGDAVQPLDGGVHCSCAMNDTFARKEKLACYVSK
jgi:hypothetical protein